MIIKRMLASSGFNGMIIGAILLSVVGISVETLPNLSSTFIKTLYFIEVITVGLFTFEYVMRFVNAENKLRFIFSFSSLIDLLAILPFFLAMALDLRFLRLLRILRLLRMLKLVRYSAAIGRFINALRLAKDELVVFCIASAIAMYIGALGIYHFEHTAQPDVYRSVFDALWWSIATATTVGYGEIYPITAGGRLFTTGFLLLSLGLVAVPTGIIASALSSVRHQSGKKE